VKRSATSQRVDKGFTLIELVVALAIIGLGLSFVLPRMMAWVDRLAFSTRQQQFELPSSWSLTVEPPIAFRYDGVCTGVKVRLSFPAGERSYRLQSPYCRPEAM